MSQEILSLRKDGVVMHVSINNPPVNLINIRMVKELFGLVGQLNADHAVKVVIFQNSISADRFGWWRRFWCGFWLRLWWRFRDTRRGTSISIGNVSIITFFAFF